MCIRDSADTRGNCTFQREGVYAEALAQAQAVRNSGGTVIVQVERIVEYGSLDTRLVRCLLYTSRCV